MRVTAEEVYAFEANSTSAFYYVELANGLELRAVADAKVFLAEADKALSMSVSSEG